jgi:hypothetical protein
MDAQSGAQDAAADARRDGSGFVGPWAGQCTPGKNGTFQMRPDCDDQMSAIQAAIGPAKAFHISIDSITLDAPMEAGKPFTFSMEVGAFADRGAKPEVHLELWGADAQCGATNLEKLTGLLTSSGTVCDTFTPTRSHSHMLLVLRSNGGHSSDVHSICPAGQCVDNTGTKQEWPGASQVFCDPEELASCEVCAADDACKSALYTVSGNGTVGSTCCGLTWQQTSDETSRTWEEAKSYCAGLSIAGGGFRLPTFAELHSLVKIGQGAAAIDGTAFPNTAAQPFWTTSTENASLDWAWAVNFASGSVYEQRMSSRLRVRCVR